MRGQQTFEPGDVTISYESGRLVGTLWSGSSRSLMPTSATEFVTREDGNRVSFEVEGGEAKAMTLNGEVRGQRK